MKRENKAMALGTMTRIENLRSIWPDEARDFTPWLAEEANLKLLSDAVGIDMVLEERESSVGSFSVDLLAKEDGSGRKIVIENQLESTNHDHMGKLITYASGKDADVVIWIVKNARDEHRKAIEWLNQRTDSSLGFFLIEIELWQIGDSLIAPKFNVVEQPNEWAKNIKVGGTQSQTKLLQLDFWSGFRESAKQDDAFMKLFTLQKAADRAYYCLRIGHSHCLLVLRANTVADTISAGFYIRSDKELYNRLRENSDSINSELGARMTWHEAAKDCSICMIKKADISDRDSWPEIFTWLREQAMILRAVFKKRIA